MSRTAILITKFCARSHPADEKGALLAWRDDISSWSNNDGYFHSFVTLLLDIHTGCMSRFILFPVHLFSHVGFAPGAPPHQLPFRGVTTRDGPQCTGTDGRETTRVRRVFFTINYMEIKNRGERSVGA